MKVAIYRSVPVALLAGCIGVSSSSFAQPPALPTPSNPAVVAASSGDPSMLPTPQVPAVLPFTSQERELEEQRRQIESQAEVYEAKKNLEKNMADYEEQAGRLQDLKNKATGGGCQTAASPVSLPPPPVSEGGGAEKSQLDQDYGGRVVILAIYADRHEVVLRLPTGTRTLREGDSIGGNTKIKAIHIDRVIIERKGVLKTLLAN